METNVIELNNFPQMQQIQQQYDAIFLQSEKLIKQKKYKKAYTLLSKFMDRYDGYNQIHLNDRAHNYNLLFKVLTKIFKKAMLKDLTKKNLIEAKIQSQKRLLYAHTLKNLITKTILNLQYTQVDLKNKLPICEELSKEIFYDQGMYHLKNTKQSQHKLQQQFQTIDHPRELDQFLYYLAICLRLFSSLDENKIYFAQSSYSIAKTILTKKHNSTKELILYVNSATRLLTKCYQLNLEDQCQLIINEINNSKAMDILQFLSEKRESELKYKNKYIRRQQKLIKPIIWFYIQSIYYFQAKMDFQKCQETIQFCKWLVYYFLKQNDELTLYVFAVSQMTFLSYKDAINFNQFVTQIVNSKEIGFPNINKLLQDKLQSIQEEQQFKQSIIYHYSSMDTTQQPKYAHVPHKIQINRQTSNDLAFIEIPHENLSSVDTRQSSRTFRDRVKSRKMNNSQISRNSLLCKSQLLHMEQQNKQIIHQLDQQNIPILDKIIKKMIDEKIPLNNIDTKSQQELLYQQNMSHKDNNFYKKLLQFKTDFNKLQQDVKIKSGQEIQNACETKFHIINRQQKMLFQSNQKMNPRFYELDQSLLSFEKPGKQLTALQKLRKIIFSHKEVFNLVKLRYKLKQQNTWYNRAIHRQNTTRRSQIYQKEQSQTQQMETLSKLRQRSQLQLLDNLNKTEAVLNTVNKALNLQRIRTHSQIKERITLLDEQNNLSRSILKKK